MLMESDWFFEFVPKKVLILDVCDLSSLFENVKGDFVTKLFLYTLTSLLLKTLVTLVGMSTLVVTEDFFLKQKGLEEERNMLTDSQSMSREKSLRSKT